MEQQYGGRAKSIFRSPFEDDNKRAIEGRRMVILYGNGS